MNAYQNWKKKIETHHPSWYSRARLAYSTSLLEFGSLGSYQWDTNTIPIFPPFSWHYISKRSKEIMELLFIRFRIIYMKISSTSLDTFSKFFNSSKMRKDLVMSNFVRLFGGISWGTFEDFKWRAPSWRFLAFWIASNTIYRWLVKCCPVLHPISEILKAEFSKLPEILSTLKLIC